MIEPITSKLPLLSRLGYAGSIQAWNPADSLESPAHAKWWVAKVASRSYDNEQARNPERLFDTIVERGHLSCLEFVPRYGNKELHLPASSLRVYPEYIHMDSMWGKSFVSTMNDEAPSIAFDIECPVFVARQWMRHRAFSYLEMSRRYVNGTKTPFAFYSNRQLEMERDLYSRIIEVYNQLTFMGEPPELARRVIPVGMMTKFWVAGFVRDWRGFISLRSDDHAQKEIRVFSDMIDAIINDKWGTA